MIRRQRERPDGQESGQHHHEDERGDECLDESEAGFARHCRTQTGDADACARQRRVRPEAAIVTP